MIVLKSPYARGTHGSGCYVVSNNRFIPICTGNSLVNIFLFIKSPVHPHMHGELS